MGVRESGEMYLEAIYVLGKRNGFVRSIDVSEYLGYSKPSVSRAMGILRSGDYILVENDGGLTLTEKGDAAAEAVSQRALVAVEMAGTGLHEDQRQVFYQVLDLISRNLHTICRDGLHKKE